MHLPISPLRDVPTLTEEAAAWFSGRWGIPAAEYRESMERCLRRLGPVPQWYVVLDGGRLIAGAGVIENDFHDRPDLAPNLCALFVEPERYGWAFLTMVTGDDQTQERMYAAPTLPGAIRP